MTDSGARSLEPGEVILFWLGPYLDGEPVRGKRLPARMWFNAAREDDERLRARFGGAVGEALDGGLAGWESHDDGRLTLILLLDQMTRNLYRGTPEMFAGDARALRLALGFIESGAHLSRAFIERAFIYMPLMHAEDPDRQELSRDMFRSLAAEAKEVGDAASDFIARQIRHADEHRDLIKRFGRFPARNTILGRKNTSAESEFLDGPKR